MTPHLPSLGERARELLVAARSHHGIINRLTIEEEGPLVRVGTFERTGPEWGLAIDELVRRGLIVLERGTEANEEVFALAPET